MPIIDVVYGVEVSKYTWQITTSIDDAYEDGAGGFQTKLNYILTHSHTDTGISSYRCGGFVWNNISIPRYSRIIMAKLMVWKFVVQDDDLNCRIYGNDVDDAANFSDGLLISRTRTAAYVPWIEDDLWEGESSWLEKTGLENIIQEIVNRDGWDSDNSLCLLIIANSDVAKAFKNRSYDYDSSYGAKLEVTWATEDRGAFSTLGFVVAIIALAIAVTTFTTKKRS